LILSGFTRLLFGVGRAVATFLFAFIAFRTRLQKNSLLKNARERKRVQGPCPEAYRAHLAKLGRCPRLRPGRCEPPSVAAVKPQRAAVATLRPCFRSNRLTMVGERKANKTARPGMPVAAAPAPSTSPLALPAIRHTLVQVGYQPTSGEALRCPELGPSSGTERAASQARGDTGGGSHDPLSTSKSQANYAELSEPYSPISTRAPRRDDRSGAEERLHRLAI
jgi:hypothetical protein